jgi:hypothetical protein
MKVFVRHKWVKSVWGLSTFSVDKRPYCMQKLSHMKRLCLSLFLLNGTLVVHAKDFGVVQQSFAHRRNRF